MGQCSSQPRPPDIENNNEKITKNRKSSYSVTGLKAFSDSNNFFNISLILWPCLPWRRGFSRVP